MMLLVSGATATVRKWRNVGELIVPGAHNAASLQGWRVLRFTPQQIATGECLKPLVEALRFTR